jgi:DNA-binding CsgD family transcriptional regulator/catechol 2,3-dioxygenase-like lactoylglutathione lyase family enzyme
MPASRRRGRPPHDDVLTPTEWRIVHAVQHGMTNRQIAARRGVSLDAVKFHVANVVAKLGLPDRRALRRWSAIPKGSALSAQISHHMNTSSDLGRIGQISRSVKDIKLAQQWYSETLGLKHLYTFGKLAFFDCGGVRLYLNEAEQPGPESILYLYVDDIQRVHRELTERGVEFVSAPHMIHRHADGVEEWMAFFNDPEQRPLAIMSQVKK